MARFTLARDLEPTFRATMWASGGGPLWLGSQAVPRHVFLVWKSPADIWHAYKYDGRSTFEHVAEGRTRDDAFRNAMKRG